jgi:tetratricopeptide (TPR) repeat protein
VLIVAAAQAGSALAALEALAGEEQLVLPLTDLAQAIPFGHIALTRLGLAVDTRRLQELRATQTPDPAALAELLDRVGNRQGDAGDRDGALASSTEAVQHYRALAETSPAAYLPDLAASLTNLSLRQGDAGDRDGALASSTEAVQHYRALAETRPAVFLPGLAMALNNLSVQRSATGDRDGALASSTEAVQHYRALAETRPAVFLPNLAMALNNLSNQQSDAGNRDGALASITDAVQIQRDLAQASPAAFLPNLAMALNNLSHMLERSDGDPWVEAIAYFDDSLPQAELRTYYARALAADNKLDAAIEQLASAAAGVASGDPVPLGRARRAIRGVATVLGASDPRLPQWATSPIPDEHVDLVNLWAAQRDWPAIDTFLSEHAGAVRQNDFRASLALIADLFPDNPVPASLTALLAEIDRDGLDTVLAAGRARHHGTELLQAWIATPTWDQSASFLREHDAELTNTQIRDLLASYSDDDACQQHLGILYLADNMPVEDVYQIVTDTTVATEHALDLIESADLNRLALILAAAPKAAEGITGAFIQTVIALATGNHDAAHQLAELIAEHGNPSQREAFAIRLRAFASHQPNPSPALDVADLIAPESGQT